MVRIILILLLLVVALVGARGVYWYLKVPRDQRVIVCPACGKEYMPYLIRMVFTGMSLEGRIIKCPHCGAQQYVAPHDHPGEKK